MFCGTTTLTLLHALTPCFLIPLYSFPLPPPKKQPISFLLETLKSEGTTVGDVELKRRLKEISTSEEQLLVIAKHFPKYRRQIKQALDNSKGNIDQFFTAAKEALAGPAGPLSI